MKKISPKIRIAFFGGSPLAEEVLPALKDAGFTPGLVVTSPDKPQGRHLVVTPPAAKVWAEKNDIEVQQPEKITPEFIDELSQTKWDLFLVAAYGIILPKALLDLPKHGTLNLHPSLLPKLRGPSPIRAAILSEEVTGVTIMLIDEKMDHGPIVAKRQVTLDTWPVPARILEERLAKEGADLLTEIINPWVSGEITSKEQDHEKATFCKKFTKEDGELDLEADSYENYKKYLALEGWPGTYFFIEKDGKKTRIKITAAKFLDGELHIQKVTPEGRQEMSYEDFLRSQK